MPLVRKIALSPQGVIGVWGIQESEEFFLDKLELSVDQFTLLEKAHKTHRLEWLASRYLVFLLSQRNKNPQIDKDLHGKPFIADSDWHISLSHTQGMAAVMASPLSVGIDIQIRTPKLDRIATKFLSSREYDTIHNFEYVDDLLHFYWGAKESMYKSYGKKKLQFNEHIIINVPHYNTETNMFKAQGQVLKEGEHFSFKISGERINSHFLVHTIEI